MSALQSIQQIQAVIDQIRITIMSDRYEETPELRGVAEDYAEICKGLNIRLGRCGEYLRQGLRGEAIEEAEAEPKLLDAVAIIESLTEDELQSWYDLAEYLDLPTSERLLDDIAITLDEAYSEQEPLQKLLGLHRKLALQRAPLAKRLSILRLITEQDPNTEFWEEDTVSYETSRLSQISTEIKQLRNSPSIEKIQQLINEIWDNHWSVKIPKKMLTAIASLDDNATRAQAINELKDAEIILREAFSEMNFSKAEPAYEQWHNNLAAAELKSDDPLALEAIAALSWCEQELSQRESNVTWDRLIARIESLLAEDNVPLEKLLQVSEEVNRLERPLPPAIGTRLGTRILGMRAQKKRLRILVGIAATVVTVSIVGLISMVVINANESSFRMDIIARINSFLQNTEIDEAEILVKKFENRWADKQAWIDTETQVLNLREKLEERKTRVLSLFKEAEAVPDNQQEQLEKVLKKTTEVAQMEPKDKGLIAFVETESRNIRSSRGIRIRQKEKELIDRISAQSDQLNELKQELMTLNIDELKKRSSRISQALVVLEEGAKGYSPTIKEEVQLLLTRVGDLDSKALLNKLRLDSKSSLSEKSRISFSSGSQQVAAYEKALNQHLKYSTGLPIHSKLKESLNEVTTWKSIEHFGKDFSSQSSELFPMFTGRISDQLIITNKFNQSYAHSPLISVVQKYDKVLKILESRYEKSNGVIARTKKLIVDDIAMKNLYVVKVKGIDWPFYMSRLEALEEKQKVIEFDSWRQDKRPVTMRFSTAKIAKKIPERAPQYNLMKQFDKQLKELSATNWESAFASMAEQVILAKQVDPILRMRLLMILQLHAKEGSLILNEHQRFITFVNDLSEKSQQVNLLAQWPDPEDEDVQKRRTLAEAYLKGLETVDFKKTWSPPVTIYDELAKKFSSKYDAIGLMSYDEEQQPILDLDIPENGNWRLLIAMPGKTKDDQFSFIQIGYADAGKATFSDSSTGIHFLPGRLVFAIAD